MRCAIVIACLLLCSCSKSILPDAGVVHRHPDALLVLPGFGYDRLAARKMRSLSADFAREGVDLYVVDYVDRSGLEASRLEFVRFVAKHRLEDYERLHIFAFIAGAWTLNAYLSEHSVPNLASVVYDRSPLQERAPRLATEELGLLAYLAIGRPVFELARTPYLPARPTGARIGLIVETRPTWLVRLFSETARSYGPIDFDAPSFQQPYDDCIYAALNHDEMYMQFDELKPDLVSFMRTGRFRSESNRIQPREDPLSVPATPSMR